MYHRVPLILIPVMNWLLLTMPTHKGRAIPASKSSSTEVSSQDGLFKSSVIHCCTLGACCFGTFPVSLKHLKLRPSKHVPPQEIRILLDFS